MNKDEIKSKIDELSSRISDLSTDKEMTSKLTDEILSLKGQYDVEYSRINIPEKDVVKEYDLGHLRIIRCRDCFIWQHKGGFSVIIKSRMKALYEYLEGLMDMRDNCDGISEDMKAAYDGNYFGISNIFMLPLFAVTDEKFFHDVSLYIYEGLKDLFDKWEKQPLQPETVKENDALANEEEAFNILQNNKNDA